MTPFFHLTTHIKVETTYNHTTLTYEPFSVSNFWRMKQCLRTLVLLIWRTVFTVKRRASTPLFDLHGHVRVQILTHEPMYVRPLSMNFALEPKTEDEDREEWLTTNEDWPRRLTTMARKTDHEERLTTIDFHDDYHTSAIWRCSVFEPYVILCSISLRHVLIYEKVFVYTFWHMRWSVNLSGNFPLFWPMWTHCEIYVTYMVSCVKSYACTCLANSKIVQT